MSYQLSLFEEPKKAKEVLRLPSVGEWIQLNPITNNKAGGTHYTSCEYALVLSVSESEIVALVPKYHQYHDVFTASIDPKHWMFTTPPFEDRIKEGIEGLGPLAKHYQRGQTDVPTAKELKKMSR
jgi:hypothetical protein